MNKEWTQTEIRETIIAIKGKIQKRKEALLEEERDLERIQKICRHPQRTNDPIGGGEAFHRCSDCDLEWVD